MLSCGTSYVRVAIVRRSGHHHIRDGSRSSQDMLMIYDEAIRSSPTKNYPSKKKKKKKIRKELPFGTSPKHNQF